jgi:hypothetical protein
MNTQSATATATQTYRSRSTKKDRRSKTAISVLKSAIYELLEAEQPMTIRHCFYRLVSFGVLDKTEAEYKGTLIRLLSKMRRNGEIPFHWLVDSTRWVRQAKTYHSLSEMAEDCKRTYRRALWREQPVYVEVWCEKDTIASILSQITTQFDVPLMVARGFSSLTFIYGAAEIIKSQNRPTHILYFGDHDPSGKSISAVLERDLRDFSDGADITFTRLAITEQQIIDLNLPTRPTKKTDSRSKNFVGESVEVDALSADNLKVLVNNGIVELIDPDAYWAVKAAEDSERETLEFWESILTGTDDLKDEDDEDES